MNIMELSRTRETTRAVSRGGVVIALIVGIVLASILVVEASAMRRESRHKKCAYNLRQIGVYFTAYERKFGAYPQIGMSTWFGQLWTSGIASDSEVFRCPFIDSHMPRTDYRGIALPGSYFPVGGATYSWTDFITDGAPPDLAMALDDDFEGTPNHGKATDRNVLFFQGRVDSFEIGSPSEQIFLRWCQSMRQGWAAPAGMK
jgi:hypothetical protein